MSVSEISSLLLVVIASGVGGALIERFRSKQIVRFTEVQVHQITSKIEKLKDVTATKYLNVMQEWALFIANKESKIENISIDLKKIIDDVRGI